MLIYGSLGFFFSLSKSFQSRKCSDVALYSVSIIVAFKIEVSLKVYAKKQYVCYNCSKSNTKIRICGSWELLFKL